jgi:hypothetical protein
MMVAGVLCTGMGGGVFDHRKKGKKEKEKEEFNTE